MNEEQLKAVKITEGPSLVLAGAGSGKTTVIIEKIKYLITEKKVEPKSILAITFTNKAANEMKERITKSITNEKGIPEISTFHSFCLKVLRTIGNLEPYVKSNFEVYGPSDVDTVLKRVVCKMGRQYTQRNKDGYINLRKLKTVISFFKNEVIQSIDLEGKESKNKYQDWNKVNTFVKDLDKKEFELFKRLYRKYEKEMYQSNALDFDDLILKVFLIFQNNREILQRYKNQFQYIMTDEFQDTNRSQYAIVHMLTSERGNITAVGDDYQSIYAFRGSDIRNVLDFEKDYPDARIVKLKKNYRSTKKIIQLANNLIKNNKNQKFKDMYPEKGVTGTNARLYAAENEIEQAVYVREEIKKLTESSQYDFGDIVLLYRNHRISTVFETEFSNSGIPYKVLSGNSFFDRSEIRDIFYYLRFFSNSDDIVLLQRIVNTPRRGIGQGTIDKVLDSYQSGEVGSLLRVFESPDNLPRVNKNTRKGMIEFYELIDRYKKKVNQMSVSSLINSLIKELNLVDTHYKSERLERKVDRRRSLNQLVEFVKKQEEEKPNLTLESFIDRLVLDSNEEEEVKGSVRMMTMHSSKGLEFPVVFLVGFDDETIPSKMAVEEEDIEEERRLAYVSITRAMERLYITYPETAYLRGPGGFLEERFLSPSMFIAELKGESLSIVR